MRILILVLIPFIFINLNSINPKKEYEFSPVSIGAQYDSLNILTKDNYRLTGWFIKSKQPDSTATILLLGSDAGNMGYNLVYASNISKYLGASVVLFDYRGFGSSEAFKIKKVQLSSPAYLNDINSVIDYIKYELPVDRKRIYVCGMSMGAALGLSVVSSRNDIAGILADSPYVTQESICKNYNNSDRKDKVIFERNAKLDPIKQVEFIGDVKVIIIHGEYDKFIPTSEISNLYEKCGSKNKTLWIAPRAPHLQSSYMYPELYLSFLQLLIAPVI